MDDPHADEWRSNSWWRALGTLDAGQLAIVESDLYTPKNALQATPSLRQKLLVTVAVDAGAKTGRGELCLYGPAGISAPRPFSISAGRHVAEPLYVPPHRPASKLSPIAIPEGGLVVLDGQILPGSTDAFPLRLAKGRRYRFKATARELQPYVGDAVPGFFNASLTLKDEADVSDAVSSLLKYLNVPEKEVPPRITAVMASNSRFTFAAGCPAFMRAEKSMPPIAVSIPIMMKQVVTIRFGFRPARRAASALPPIA